MLTGVSVQTIGQHGPAAQRLFRRHFMPPARAHHPEIKMRFEYRSTGRIEIGACCNRRFFLLSKRFGTRLLLQ
jgi:hypothetical protein